MIFRKWLDYICPHGSCALVAGCEQALTSVPSEVCVHKGKYVLFDEIDVRLSSLLLYLSVARI